MATTSKATSMIDAASAPTGSVGNAGNNLTGKTVKNGKLGVQAKRKTGEEENALLNSQDDAVVAAADGAEAAGIQDGTQLAQAEAVGAGAASGGAAAGAGTAAGVGMSTGMMAGVAAVGVGVAAAAGGGGGGGGGTAALAALPVSDTSPATPVTVAPVAPAPAAPVVPAAPAPADPAPVVPPVEPVAPVAPPPVTLTTMVDGTLVTMAASSLAATKAALAADAAYDAAAAKADAAALKAEAATTAALIDPAEMGVLDTLAATVADDYAAALAAVGTGLTATGLADLMAAVGNADTKVAAAAKTPDTADDIAAAADFDKVFTDAGVTKAEYAAVTAAAADVAYADLALLAGAVGPEALRLADVALFAGENIGTVRAAGGDVQAAKAASTAADDAFAAAAPDAVTAYDIWVAAVGEAGHGALFAGVPVAIGGAAAEMQVWKDAAVDAGDLAKTANGDADAAAAAAATALATADMSNAVDLAVISDALGIDANLHVPVTINNFDAGPLVAGGDIIDMSGIAGLTDSVATGLTLGSNFTGNNVFIFDDTAISVDAAAAAIAADASVTATQGYIVIRDAVHADAVHVYHSTDLGANGAETALVILSGVNITSLTAANFLV